MKTLGIWLIRAGIWCLMLWILGPIGILLGICITLLIMLLQKEGIVKKKDE